MEDLKLLDALVKSNQEDNLKEVLASKYIMRIAEKEFNEE